MPEKINLNTTEYNDDFDASKNFYKVLFRPGYSIQTRELNTLQSILQNQIEQFGKYQFKQGQQVIPGGISFNNQLNYVKLSKVSEVSENVGGEIVTRKYDIKDLKGVTLVGLTSGVRAIVIDADYATETESDILFVNYVSGGDNSEKTFRQGEDLEAIIDNSPILTVGTDGASLPSEIISIDPDTLETSRITSPAMGFASAVKVETGIYFVNGFFVQNEEQILIVDKYYNQPSVKVGFSVREDVITAEKDVSLYDNARGFSNYSAPGAHRLKIDLTLVSYQLTDSQQVTDDNFIELLKLKLGVVQKKVSKKEYNIIEETLARRTYDESGDYVVDNFPIDLREWSQSDTNQGIYPKRIDGKYGPVIDPVTGEDGGLASTDAEASLAVGFGPGKAYVRGYEIVNKETKYYRVEKARDTLDKDNNRVKTFGLPSFNVRNVYNTIPLNSEGTQLSAYPTVYFSQLFNDGYLGYNGTYNSRKTLSRRGNPIKSLAKTNLLHDYGVKTIYLKPKSPASDYSSLLGQKLWYVSNLGTSLAATSVDYVEVIAYSQITRPDDIGGEVYIELTVLGNKRFLHEQFIEYDNADFLPQALSASALNTDIKRKQLFYKSANSTSDNGAFNAQNYYWQSTGTQVQVTSITYEVRVVGQTNTYIAKVTTATPHGLVAGQTVTVAGAQPDVYNTTSGIVLASNLAATYFEYALASNPNASAAGQIVLTVPISQANTIVPFGEIVDYSRTITPIVGIAKPKNFSLLKRGSGFNQDTDKVISKGKDSSGNDDYNSVFKFEYFNPIYFTRLTTDSKIVTGFTSGQYIVGSTSGAYAVIEGSADSSYTSSNELFVKVLSGNFVSGETIKDESGNTLRIALENTISHFVVTKRGSGYTQSSSDVASSPLSLNGKNIDVQAVKPQIVGGQVISIDIKDRKNISEAYTSPPTVVVRYDSSTPVNSSCVVRAELFKNTVFTYSNDNVKSFYTEFGDGNNNTFTADVDTFDESFTLNKNVTNLTWSGTKGRKFLTCLSFSGDASLDLLPGDVIQYLDVNGVSRRNRVEYVTPPSGVARSVIYLDTALPENVTNSVVIRKRSKIDTVSNASLIYPVGFKSVNSLIKDSDNTNFTYYARRDFITTSSTSGGKITFSAQLKYGSQRFIGFTESNFLLTVLDKGNSNTGLQTGDVMYVNADQISFLSSGGVAISLDNVTFRTDSSSASNVILKLTATIEVSKASVKTKTAVRQKRIVVTSVGDKIVPLRGYDYDEKTAEIISYSDCFGEYGSDIKVFEGSISNPPNLDDNNNVIEGSDVTERFTFDDGQRDTFYDVSRLVLKPGYETPTGQLVIVFNYFEHSQGDFSIVDSYTLTGCPVSDIPNFDSPSLGKISLRDVIDFRPKVDITTIIPGFQNKTILESNNTISFTKSGGIPSATPAYDSNLDASFIFTSKQYLDRIDGLFLNSKGNFIVKKGNSSLNPSKPESLDDAIPLYYLYIPAYTNSPQDVRVTPVDNRRYTMRDIGKLEKRIERLEYYTTMSILEQQTFNTQIKDEIGLDRFKSGIIVDSFENHGVGNLASLDYKCAIDTQQAILKPQTTENSFALVEVNTTTQERTTNGYTKTGSVITLPYGEVPAVSNKYATSVINPNPFVVVQYVGDLSLSPSIDHWFDTNKKPNILNNDTKVFSVFVSKAEASEGYRSINNFYLTNWVGTNRAFYNISSLNEITSDSNTTVSSATISTSSNISPQNNEIGKGIQTTSNGNVVVASSIQLFARQKVIKFVLRRLKPNTKFYAYIDGRSVGRWIAQDTRFTGIPDNSVGVFGANADGSAITTDANGDASGILLFPAGYAPVQGASWTGDIGTISYDTSLQLNFTTGVKTIRFTTNSLSAEKDNTVTSFAEAKYYCTGTFPSQPASIISTIPSFLKAEEGIQFIDNASTQAKPNPLSQTFRIEKYDGGLFLTGVDLFFSSKSETLPIRVYLTDTQSGKPGNYVIPGSEVVKSSNTYLKVYTSGSVELTIGETISGIKSGVKGYLKAVIDNNDNQLVPSIQKKVSLTNTQVYTLVLSNYVSTTGSTSFEQNEELSIPTVNTANTLNNTTLTVTIAKDSGRISSFKVKDFGAGYESATLIIQSPQLPGGSNALGSVSISNGEVYEANVILGGSGYTDTPSVILRQNGSISKEAVIEPIIQITTPAVRMGVSVDPNDGVIPNSTSPTNFKFDHPIFLQNNTDYTLCVETDSVDYKLWSSSLGGNDIATSQVITQQPLLGSVFTSQNIDAWLEDLNKDLKFTLYRAKFDTTTQATLELTNEDLGYELLPPDSIQTDASSNDSATSLVYGANNKIVKIYHPNNGFEDSGKSYVSFHTVQQVGGIESDYINSSLFPVSNGSVDFYTITSNLGAGSTTSGGGKTIYASYNRKYEKLYPQVSYLSFSPTPLKVEVKTTNIIPIDGKNQTYNSYQSSDYEIAFLNEEQYFTNQKVVASSFNELKNNIGESLKYKMTFSTKVDNLSPIFDLRNSSIKLTSNIIEKSYGKETRYGRRQKVLSFYPIYKFDVTGLPTDSAGNVILPTTNQTVSGNTSKTLGEIVKVTGSLIYVKIKNSSLFTARESLTFSVQSSFSGVAVSPSGATEVPWSFTPGTNVEVYREDLTNRFSNQIFAKIINWDDKNKKLYVLEEKAPINGNYTAAASGTTYGRNSSNNGANQLPDVIRVNDKLWHQKISPAFTGDTNESVPGFVEVKSTDYTTGLLYISDINSKNSSSTAKYVTKEITLQNAATTIEVRSTANLFESDDVEVYYKTKPLNSQNNFDDIEWIAFNGNGLSDDLVTPVADAAISGLFEKQSLYKEHKYSITNLIPFGSFAIKIVMKASNPCYIPKIQDIRIVAAY